MTGGIVLIYASIAVWVAVALWWFRWKMAKVIVFGASLLTLGLIGVLSLCGGALEWIENKEL